MKLWQGLGTRPLPVKEGIPALSPFILLTAHLLKWPIEALTLRSILGNSKFPVCRRPVWSTAICLTSRPNEQPPRKVILIHFRKTELRKNIPYLNGPINVALQARLLFLGSMVCLLLGESRGVP